jgi:ABC-type polysaccharide/polyol phosphate export permease
MPSLSQRVTRLFQPAQRNLLRHLIRSHFKTTDQATTLGNLWSLIMPVFFTAVMYFLFRGRFSDGQHGYVLFIMVGVSTVGFFLNSIFGMMSVLIVNREMVLNTTVPRELLFVSTLANALWKYLIELLLVFGVAIFIGDLWWAGLPLLIPLILALCAMMLGLGFIMGLLACLTRDVQYFWALISRVLLFATPIFYPLNRLSPIMAKVVYWGNPLSPFLVAMRRILIGQSAMPFITVYIHSLALGFIGLTVGFYLFVRFESGAVERS